MMRITIRFYEELNFFLPPSKKKRDIDVEYLLPRSVKDLIESFGIPHVEVDLILVNGVSKDFSYFPSHEDRISVYPVFERLDIGDVTRLRPEPLRIPRFIADVHLKTLNRRLRMLGFDTVYDPSLDDPRLAERAAEENRILLSRDRGLLMRSNVQRGLYVRNTIPDCQIREVVERLDLYRLVKPFSRCISCNGTILKNFHPECSDIEENRNASSISTAGVPERIQKLHRDFSTCSSCGKVYWKGSHYYRMMSLVDDILSNSPY